MPYPDSTPALHLPPDLWTDSNLASPFGLLPESDYNPSLAYPWTLTPVLTHDLSPDSNFSIALDQVLTDNTLDFQLDLCYSERGLNLRGNLAREPGHCRAEKVVNKGCKRGEDPGNRVPCSQSLLRW